MSQAGTPHPRAVRCICQRARFPIHPAAMVYADADLIWFLFMLRVSLMRLNLLPAHPDRTGGIGLVGKSSIAFTPFLFAQGALLAGQIASRIFYNRQSLLSFKLSIAGFVGFFVAAVLVPLLLFIPQLWRAKREGLAEYGILATEYVREFDQKWLRKKVHGEQLLGSATYSHSLTLVTALRSFVECELCPLQPTMWSASSSPLSSPLSLYCQRSCRSNGWSLRLSKWPSN
jgi:hypothetical protein